MSSGNVTLHPLNSGAAAILKACPERAQRVERETPLTISDYTLRPRQKLVKIELVRLPTHSPPPLRRKPSMSLDPLAPFLHFGRNDRERLPGKEIVV
jgi:hypothetical protein